MKQNGSKVYEKDLQKEIIVALNKIDGCYVENRHAGPGKKGRPDITGILYGTRIEIEVKLPGNTPTPKQWEWINKWRSYGAISCYVISVDMALNIINLHVKTWKNEGKI